MTDEKLTRAIDLGETQKKPPKKSFLKKPKPTKRKGKIEYGCEECGLWKNCNSPKMDATGNGEKEILIVAEIPGVTEDRDGIQLIGQAGRLLRRYLKPFDIDIDRDCWKINAVNCFIPSKRKPTNKEIKCCRWKVDEAIEKYKPKFIWIMGTTALKSFYGGIFSDCTISRWRNLCIPDPKTGAWILPLFHPSYIVRNETDLNLTSTYERDLKFAVSCLRKTPPTFTDYAEEVEIITDYDYLCSRLKELSLARTLAFDYETTSLLPFDEEQRIWSISASAMNLETLTVETISFPFSYPHWTDEEREVISAYWEALLLNPKIKKVAHNMKFEDVWTREIFGIDEIANWEWCSMNVAHILDSRKSFTGLKFQAYINFGVYPYDGDVKKFIKPAEGSRINRLDEVPLEKLLLYGGIDARLTLDLYELQNKKLRPTDRRRVGLELFMDGLETLADAQMVGIKVDQPYYQEQKEVLGKKIERINKQITESNAADDFKLYTGYPLEVKTKDFSTKDLRTLFFDVLGLDSVKLTEKGMDSVDRDVLEQLKHPIATKIVARRKLAKIKNTYLDQFDKAATGGFIHPFLDLHNVASYRSSGSQPNLQNQPKRDAEAAEYIRRGFYPHDGQQLGEFDFGSLEVRIIGCASRDPRLVKYINDPSTDMHDDQAADLFMLDEEQRTKEIRFYAKNCWVFPQFYGSSAWPCAGNLWSNCIDLKTAEDISVKRHLRNQGIKTFDDFVDHVTDCEADFWQDFTGVRDWQSNLIADYQYRGFVEMFFGFRRGGYLSDNQIINSGIQGSAFHLLLWAMIQSNREFKERKLRSRIIGEIHDSIMVSIQPEELETVVEIMHRNMIIKPQEEFDWLIVPLTVEFELGGVDESWWTLEERDDLIEKIAA